MDKYWIGKVGNAFFIYDTEIQSGEIETVTLFSYSFDQPVKLDKNLVRQRIYKVPPENENLNDILRRYRNWKQFYRSELEKINSEFILDTTEFLNNVQSGVVKAYWGRKAHCYKCATSLTGKRGNICRKCFWIICSCGACGCGWNPNTVER